MMTSQAFFPPNLAAVSKVYISFIKKMTMDICESMFQMNSLFQTWWIPNPNVLKSKELETCMKQKNNIYISCMHNEKAFKHSKHRNRATVTEWMQWGMEKSGQVMDQTKQYSTIQTWPCESTVKEVLM